MRPIHFRIEISMPPLPRQPRPGARAALSGLAMVLLLAAPAPLAAQATGRVVGRVVDASGTGLPDVAIQVVGTTLGTQSGVDGRYAIGGVPAGTVSLLARRIGFAPKTITGLVVGPGRVLQQDLGLTASAVQLTAQVVTAEAERGSVSAALDAQRHATGIVNAVTAEQISRSPDSDAAQAVQRVSGVTVQDGKYVFVRGLGERYTTTSLNGARLPSPEPERKVVPLDLFPASLLQSVTTAKTFTPDRAGDFGGAAVELRTREFPAQRQLVYSLSTGHNSAATGRAVVAAPRVGLEWLGIAGHERAIPSQVLAAGPTAGGSDVVSAFRNVWTPTRRDGAPNLSASVSLGGSDRVLGRDVGYVGAFSYQYGSEVRAAEERAFAIVGPDGGTVPVDAYRGSTGRESVLWGGLLNLSAMAGAGTRLSFDNTFSRSSDNEARVESGLDENFGLPLDLYRLRFVERTVWSSRLAGEHERDRRRLEWSLTGSGVSRREPDRSEAVYATDEPGGAPFLLADPQSAVRTFGDLTERSLAADADYLLRLGGAGGDHSLKVGALGRYTSRDARNDVYSLSADLPREQRERPAEEIFALAADGRHAFRSVPLSQGGSYGASDAVGAAYAMGEYQLAERLRLVGGARLESQRVEVAAEETFGRPTTTTRTYTDLLPSLALNVRLTERQNFRVSASQTLARPEYREIAAVASRDVIGGEVFRGNPELRRSLIQNADVRWEWYPNSGEVLSLGVFAKRFDDPIERVYRGTSGTRVTTFENAVRALNYGAELEVRKQLGGVADALAPVTVFTNATLMRSEIDVRGVGAGAVEGERAMVGQAPYVVNAGLIFAPGDGAVNATFLYNVVGRRIFAASLLPLPSVYEEDRHVVDFSLRFPIRGGLAGKLDAKNLLDAPYEVTQGTVTRERWLAGRTVSLGLTWRP